MAIFDTLRRILRPGGDEDPHAPYLAHYHLVDRRGEIYKEADVPVVFFEDGPAIVKAMLLNRAEPERNWRWVRTAK
jgi:hypothetical protein